jgi:hypothetical protein
VHLYDLRVLTLRRPHIPLRLTLLLAQCRVSPQYRPLPTGYMAASILAPAFKESSSSVWRQWRHCFMRPSIFCGGFQRMHAAFDLVAERSGRLKQHRRWVGAH